MLAMLRHLSIIVLLGALALSAGCRKKASPKVPAEPPTPPPQVSEPAPSAIIPSAQPGDGASDEVPPAPAAAPPPAAFLAAEQDFAAGEYQQAADGYENFLRGFPQAPERDRALFRLGVSLALAGDGKEMRPTEAAFRRLVEEFPKSPYRRQAEWLLGMQARLERMQSDLKDRDDRIKQLGEELRKLKSIDLDRRPSRPE